MRSSQLRSAGCLFAFVIGLTLSLPRIGQGQVFGRQTRSTNGRFIEAPRSLLSRLRAAKQAIEADQINEAVVQLGEISARQIRPGREDDLSGQDFFIDFDEVGEGKPASKSLLRTVRQQIGDLPVKGIETYELRYGPIARKELRSAAAHRDWQAVESVRRCYFHTLAGYEASYLLAQRQMFLGHPLYASLLLDEVTSYPRAIEHLGVSVFLVHALARSLANRPLPPIDRMAGRVIRTGEESLTIESADQLAAWIDNNVQLREEFEPVSVSDYAMFGGQPNRNGTRVGQMPLSQARWRLPTSNTPRQHREIESIADELTSSGQLPPPSWLPLKVGDQLIMRTTELLLGVDYETGKRLWAKPWESGYEPQADDEAHAEEIADAGERRESLRKRIWNDVPYGHVSSDGTRVFMLADLSNIRIAMLSPMRMRGLRPADASTNTLYALDLESEGKLLWKLGQGGAKESPFADAFFLGPPLPVDGLLYVMVEIAGDINLCCLDPSSGAERWRQHLVAVESGGIDIDPIRRICGAMPTYHEGVLICPVGAGVTIAIDLADRVLRWGATYQRNRSFSGMQSNRFGERGDQYLHRWDVGAAVASQTSVLLTPPETNRMYCFDLVTGKYRFSERTRMKFRYLAGIRGDRFFLVGTKRIQAFDLEKGTEVWTSRPEMLAAGQQIAGRGVFGEDDYLIPTTTNELVRISLASGEVLQRRHTRYGLGNLVAVETDLIVQGPTMLSVAYGERTLEPIINRMLEKNPDNFEALVRKAELLIEQSRRSEALDLLGRARKLSPEDHMVRSLSVTAMLGLLREDPEVGEQYVQVATELIEQPSHWIELLALRAKGAMDRGEYVNAAKRLIEMSTRLLQSGNLEGLSNRLIADPSRTCTLDAWIAARMHEIRHEASAQQRERIETLIETDLKQKDYFSASLLARLRRYYEGWQSVSTVYPLMLSKYQEDHDWMAIERMLIGSRRFPSGEMEGVHRTELWLMANNFADAKMLEDAVRVLDVYEKQLVKMEMLKEEQRDQIQELRDRLGQGTETKKWPSNVRLIDWTRPNIGVNRSRIGPTMGETLMVGGSHYSGWRVLSDANSQLSIRNPLGITRGITGQALLRGSAANTAQISGSTLVAMTVDSLICIDLNQHAQGQASPVRWRRSFAGDGGAIAKRIPSQSKFGGPIHRYTINAMAAAARTPELVLGPVLGDRVIYLQGGDLIAIDLLTKEVLWRNSDAPVQGAVLVEGDQVAVVSDNESKVAFFNLHDGEKQSTRQWNHGVIWDSAGRHVLSYVDPERKNHHFEIRLTNPFQDNVLLRQASFGANRRQSGAAVAYGQIVSGRYLAWIQSDGQALVWDILQGTSIASPKVPTYDDLNGLHALEVEGKFVLLPARKRQRPGVDQIGQELITQSGQSHRTANAAIAVDAKTGETLWTTEFAKPWGCTTTLAYGSPLIAFVRSHVERALTDRPRRKVMDVMFLRSDDGREVFRKEGKIIQMSNRYLETKLIVQPQVHEVVAYIGSTESLFFRFDNREKTEKNSNEDSKGSEGE